MDIITDPKGAASVPVSTAQPDPAAAVKFLEEIAGGLPVSVAEIPRDGEGGVRGFTFSLPADRDALTGWIREREGRANLYYSLNAPAPDRVGCPGRLKKKDVAHIRGIELDLDPGTGPLDQERAKLWGRVTEAETAGGPFDVAPSYVIDSGSGVQMLWLFDKPLSADADTAAAVEAQARGMERRFGSDAVHSLEHLFRLPFTRNLPNEKKRARGRVEATASVWRASGHRHALGFLEAIAQPIHERAAKSSAADIDLDYAAVREACADPDALAPELRTIFEGMQERAVKLLDDLDGDRSDASFALAAKLITERGLTDPTELASVVFALLPDRLDEEDAKGRGEAWCAGTIAKALGQTRPLQHYFLPATADDLAEVDRRIAARSGAGRNKRFRFLRMSDIRAMRPPKFLIKRHLPECSTGLLYGPPGTYKSFIALDWALHIAHGLRDWHGDRVHSKPDGWVLYLAREGATGIQSRLEAWHRKHEMMGAPDARFILMPAVIDFLDQQHMVDLVKEAREEGLNTISLIVADTVSRSIVGADENSQQDMSRFAAACDKLKDEFACAVLGVHHSAKSGSVRGSSVIPGASDFIFKVTGEELKSEGSPRRVKLYCEKQKDAPDQWSDDYWLDSVGLGWTDEDGDEVTSLVPRRTEKVERQRVDSSKAQAWARIVHTVMGDREEAPFVEIREGVTTAANAERLINAKSPQRVTGAASEAIGPLGVDLDLGNGKTAHIAMHQKRESGPWSVRQIVTDSEAVLAEPRKDE